MKKIRNIICLVLLNTFIFSTGFTKNIVEYIGEGENQITVIYLKGKPYEMGLTHGRQLKEPIHALYDSLMKSVANYTSPNLLDLAYMRLEPFISQDYKDEMQGLADGAEIDIKMVHRLHAIPDLSETDCSFFAAWDSATIDGNLYQIRALDYATEIHLQEHPAIVVYEPENGQRFINVGWVGFIGVVSGINYAGISISEIGDDFDKANQTMMAEPMPFVLRDVLQNSAHLDEAIQIISNAKRTSSFLYCVGDAKIPEARSFMTGPTICHVYSDDTSPNPFINDVVYFSMGTDSPWNQKMFNFLNPLYGKIDGETGKNLMRTLKTGDLHAVAYDYAHRQIWVANAGIDRTDAFKRTFVKYDMNRADSIFAKYPLMGVNVNDHQTPSNLKLYQNHPNPFNSTTRIEFEIAKNQNDTMELSIFDITGKKVQTLKEGFVKPGYHHQDWNGLDQSGKAVATGSYFCQLKSGGEIQMRRMILIR
jgi:hypothetical protein